MASTRHHPGITKSCTFYCGAEELTCIQSLGWEHYEVHEPEPHILLFKYVQHISYFATILLTCELTPIIDVRSTTNLPRSERG